MSLVLDASVFLAGFRSTERHYRVSEEFLSQVALAEEIICPSLVLVECAAATVRTSGSPLAARRAVEKVKRAFPIEFVLVIDRLLDQAIEAAISCRTRGADSCYIAVAKQAGATLITWDLEMLERGAALVTTMTPEQWLEEQARPA